MSQLLVKKLKVDIYTYNGEQHQLKDLLEEHFIWWIVSHQLSWTTKTNMKDKPIVEVEDEEKEEPIDEKKFMEP